MTERLPDGQEVEHHYADLEDVRLHYVSAGDPERPLLILLHGFPEFWYSWRYQIPVLAQAGFRVLAPDMRGYNLSSKPGNVESYDSDYLSRDVMALIKHEGHERASVVGHDWGGAVAWHFAMRYPQNLKRLVILNCPHPAEFPTHLVLDPGQILKSLYMFIFQVPGLGERLMSHNNYAKLRRLFRNNPINPLAFTSDDIEKYIESAARPGALTAMTNYYRAAARSITGSGAVPVKPVHHPVLVIWGQQDTALGPQLANVSARLAADLTVKRIPHSSHWVQIDAPKEVNQWLLEFLKPDLSSQPAESDKVSPGKRIS
jgi:epoxide hydrolase 4